MLYIFNFLFIKGTCCDVRQLTLPGYLHVLYVGLFEFLSMMAHWLHCKFSAEFVVKMFLKVDKHSAKIQAREPF